MKDIIKKYLIEAQLKIPLKQYVVKWLEYPTGNRPYGGGGWSSRAKYRPKPELITIITSNVKFSGKSIYVNGIRKRKLNIYLKDGTPIREDYYNISFNTESLNEARLKKKLKPIMYSLLKKHGLLGKGVKTVTHGIKYEAPYSQELVNDLEAIGYQIFPHMVFIVNNPNHEDYGKKYIEFNIYIGPDSPNRGLYEDELDEIEIQPTEVPKWEDSVNRGKANPIDYKQKWESGLTRGHANSLF